MNESKSFDTWEVNETINEDFDFGEGGTQANPIKIKAVNKYNKKIISLIFAMVMVFFIIIGIGYRAYSHKSLAFKNTYNTTELIKTSLSAETTNPTSTPKNIIETAEELKKQPNEVEAVFQDSMPSAPMVPEFTSTPPKVAIVPTPISEDTSLPVLNVPAVEKNKLLEDIEAPQLRKNLNALNNQIDSILNQIKYLDTYSKEVSDNLNKLKTSLSTMDNRLLNLIELTATLSQDVGTVKSEMGQIRQTLKENSLDSKALFSSTKPQRSTITIAEPEYKVHAIIPGRAWLKSLKGQIITVTEGDSIGYYGKVLVIDAANGVVLIGCCFSFIGTLKPGVAFYWLSFLKTLMPEICKVS